ncbi:MAG: glycosyltransferase [Thermoplasmatales archaeon]
MPKKENVCGIIVTYNPNENCLFAIERNCSTLAKVIIYDNSTINENIVLLSKLVNNLNRKFKDKKREVILIRGPQNIGLSRAYNHCASIARGLGFTFILLLDQDSFFENSSFEILLEEYDHINALFPVGAISPSYIQEGGRFYDFLYDGRFKWKDFYYSDHIIELRDLINSGMLISIRVFDSISGYDEGIFLDNSDLNFTLRLRLNGYRLFQSSNSKLIHNYGDKVPPKSKVNILYRAPDRDFFIKDLIGCLPIAWKISFVDLSLIILLLCAKIFSTLLLKDKKKQRFAYIVRGIRLSVLFDTFKR